MGQKTHPSGFRLVTTQKHTSEWYSDKLNYSKLIERKIDQKLREKLPKGKKFKSVEVVINITE